MTVTILEKKLKSRFLTYVAFTAYNFTIESSVCQTEQMHACRFLPPLLPNRAIEVFNKEKTIRFRNACISVHNAGNAQNFAVGLETTRKHVQIRKWPSSPTRNDEIEARLHQTSCPLTRPGLQRLGQTHQESTSPPMAVDERQAWHPCIVLIVS